MNSRKSVFSAKMISMVSALILGMSVLAVPTYSEIPNLALQKVSNHVLSLMAAGETGIPVLVMFNEKADLSGADRLRTRAQKGRFVYDTLRTTALRSQKQVVEFLTKAQVKFRAYYLVNTIAIYNADADLIQQLAQFGEIRRVIGNPKVKTDLPQVFGPHVVTDNSAVAENISAVGAPQVWEKLGVTGENIVVAGQDTGVEWTHPALKNSYRGNSGESVDHNYNWHDAIHDSIAGGQNPCGYNAKAPCDDNDHGTHTIGTVVGSDGGDNQIGMAPKAKWIACRNMDLGTGTPATYLECFEFFLAPYPHGGSAMTDGDPSKAPHVINNSWGCPPSEGCEGGEFVPALQALEKAGIMVVVSAGNDGPGCGSIVSPPATHTSETFSVGAHNHRNGLIASFSSRGPSKFDGGVGPDVTAPGVGVKSAVTGGNYAQSGWSGTSMAGPHVVGLVALMWSAKPSLIGNIPLTSELIRKTAAPQTSAENCGGVSGSQVPNNTFGFGHIDAVRAVEAAMKIK